MGTGGAAMVYLLLLHLAVTAACPCTPASLCQPIEGVPSPEVFVFSLNEKNFQQYDSGRVTTIAVTYASSLNVSNVCWAHAHGIRVVAMANFPKKNLTRPDTFQPWVDEQISRVKSKFLDGINVDFEDVVDDVKSRDGLSELIELLTRQMKASSPHYQVTFDVAWSPRCIDQRCYDYARLAAAVDYAFVMSYDERSQFRAPCVAWANSPLNMTATGLADMLKLGIPPSKLILGLPWYGYRYPCLHYDAKRDLCEIAPISFRGSECSDAVGREVDYSELTGAAMLGRALAGRRWDDVAYSPYFTYKDAANSQIYQVWYDDPTSLGAKTALALDLGLAGVGMWNADSVDYTNTTQSASMWATLPPRQQDKRVAYEAEHPDLL